MGGTPSVEQIKAENATIKVETGETVKTEEMKRQMESVNEQRVEESKSERRVQESRS